METLETTMRRLLQHRLRHLFVITLTFLAGLVTIWPAADEYSTLRNRQRELTAALAEAEVQVGQLDDYRNLASQRHDTLAELQGRTVSENNLHQFSTQLVELARQSGCRLLKIRPGANLKRPWKSGDHPLESKSRAKSGEITPYRLLSQQLSVSVSGSLSNVKRMLTAMEGTGKLAHPIKVQLRSAGSDGRSVILDLELVLFDLVKEKPQSTSA